jgi:hypothetical protein
MNTLISHGVKALAIASLLATSACSTTGLTGSIGPMAPVSRAAAQPLPPVESDPQAVTFKNMETVNYTVLIDDGFDSTGTLRRRTKLTYNENRALAQINNFCATGIQDYVKDVGWQVLKRTFRSGGAQVLGSGISTALAFQAPTPDLYRQVVGLTTGTGMFAAWDAADYGVSMTLMGAHAGCVSEMLKRHPSVTGSLVGIQLPGLKGKPLQVMAPGEEAPAYDD